MVLQVQHLLMETEVELFGVENVKEKKKITKFFFPFPLGLFIRIYWKKKFIKVYDCPFNVCTESGPW